MRPDPDTLVHLSQETNLLIFSSFRLRPDAPPVDASGQSLDPFSRAAASHGELLSGQVLELARRNLIRASKYNVAGEHSISPEVLVMVHASVDNRAGAFAPKDVMRMLGVSEDSHDLPEQQRIHPERHDSTLSALALEHVGVYQMADSDRYVRFDRPKLGGPQNLAKVLLFLCAMRDPDAIRETAAKVERALEDRVADPRWFPPPENVEAWEYGQYLNQLQEAQDFVFLDDLRAFREIWQNLSLPRQGDRSTMAARGALNLEGIMYALGGPVNPYHQEFFGLFREAGVGLYGS